MKALVALGKARDPALVQRYLDFAFSGQVRSNNVLYVFATLAGNRHARDLMWQFVKENWESKIIPWQRQPRDARIWRSRCEGFRRRLKL